MSNVTLAEQRKPGELIRQKLDADEFLRHRDIRDATQQRPVRLPDGLRFPYELYIQDYRVRNSMIIFFVPNMAVSPNEVIIEWDEISHNLEKKERILALEQVQLPKPISPPDAYAFIIQAIPDAHVLFYEPVIDTSLWNNGHFFLCMRVEYISHGQLWAIFLGRDHDGGVIEQIRTPEPISKGNSDWKYEGISYSRMHFKINLKRSKKYPLPDDDNLQRIIQHQQFTFYTVMICFGFACRRLRQLGYEGFEPQNIRLEFVNDSEYKAFTAQLPRDKTIPIIYLGRVINLENKELTKPPYTWGDDTSVVLHEFAHAFWNSKYPHLAGTEAHINKIFPGTEGNDTVSWKELVLGIEEGFADFWACTFLDQNQHIEGIVLLKRISELLWTISRYREHTRLVTQNPPTASLNTANRHSIGHHWVNFLWDLRTRIIGEPFDLYRELIADRLIIDAHISPPSVILRKVLEESPPKNPFEAYITSLKIQMLRQDIYIDWEELEYRHPFI
jgi:hypothetical protein